MAQASDRIGMLVMAAAVLAAVTGCGGGSEKPPPAPVSSSLPPAPPNQRGHGGFDLIPPPGFTQIPTDGQQGVAAEFTLPGEGPGTVRAGFNVVVGPIRADLPTTVDSARRLMRSLFSDYRPTVDEATTVANGRRGWLLGGRYTLRGAPVRNLQLFLIGSELSYVVTGTTSDQRGDEFDPVFRKMFASFNVK